jgi:hypothetical protein
MAHEAPEPASGFDPLGALREAALAGLIAFGVLLPLIGFDTVPNIRNELVVETRCWRRWWRSLPPVASLMRCSMQLGSAPAPHGRALSIRRSPPGAAASGAG